MAEKEKIFTIPLRREFLKAPVYKRTKKATSAVRGFLQKHMKNENVKLGKYLNKKLLEQGRKNPPRKVQVKVWPETKKVKDKEIKIVKAELVGAPVEEEKEEEKKKSLKEKLFKKKEEKPKEEVEKEEKEKEKRKVLEHAKLEKHEKMTGKEKIPTAKQVEKARRETMITATGKK